MMMSPNKSFDKSIYASVREKFAPRISYERISFYIFFLFFFFYEESRVELIFRRKFKKNRKARKKGSTNQKSC